MRRVTLLATDRSSSAVKMTTTGQTTTSGMKRTTATRRLFSHFMFLTGLLLITLLTSGKAMADTYTITLTGSNLTLGDGNNTVTQDKATRTFTLVAAEGYKLPEVGDIAVSITGGDPIDNGAGEAQWSYIEGTITLGYSVDLAKGITVTANGVAKDIATLKTFTYKLDGKEPVAVTGFTADVHNEGGYTVSNLAFANKVYLAGTVTDHSGAIAESPEAVKVTIDESNGTGSAKATLTVTAKDGTTTKTYTVNFTFNKAKITGVTAPEAQTLDNRVASADEVIQRLPATIAVTTENPAITSLKVVWKLAGGSFNAAGGKSNSFTWTATVLETLDANAQTLTGEVNITNAAASTDATLSALTYSIDGGGAVAVTGFKASDNEKTQNYTVTLLASTAKTAKITVAATAKDERAKIAPENLGATLNNNTAKVTITVTAESGAARTINITFNRTASDVATLSQLKYKVGGDSEIAISDFKADGTTYAVELPYTTQANAVITILPVATDPNATIAPDTKTVTLASGIGNITLTVTADNGVATQNITISFTTAKEKITSITAPTAPQLTKVMTAEEVLKEVQKITKVTVTSEGSTLTELPITWVLKGEFDATEGAENTYTWTIDAGSYANYDINGQKTTGDVVVTNYVETVIGELTDVTIDASTTYTQIGDGKSNTTANSVTVDNDLDKLAFNKTTVSTDVTINTGKVVKELTFKETTVTGKLNLNGDVPSLILSNTNIGEIALASGKTTTLSLQSGNQIDKITNNGTLTLQDAATPAVVTLSMAIETRAALANTGDVKAVENNGVFTDETASIVAVTGDADLSITSLPTSESTTGNKATLSVDAESTGGTVSYQWQSYSASSGWTNIGNSTRKDLEISKTVNGSTQYRCEVKSTNSSDQAKTTTLYTPAVTVTFRTESTGGDPAPTPTPTPKTYTVKLAKVTGATFSQKEETTVTEGGEFSFKITLDKDYDQSKPVVTVDGKAIEAAADGSYTIKNIRKDIEIVVTGIVKNTATGIEETVADAARAWSVGSTLYIHVPEKADVYVFNAGGALQQQLQGALGDYNMQLRAGFYIVRIGKVSQKIIIR